MRGKKAKKLRKQIYGSEFSPRERRYTKRSNKTGAIYCVGRRQQYQQLKKETTK